MIVLNLVTCGGCNQKFDRSACAAEYISGRWYHPGCAISKKEKQAMTKYICELFNLKALGPVNNRMITKYVKERGYTYSGIANALKYFYEIKKNQVHKAEERVGIVPYVYSEAEEYFRIMELRNKEQQERIMKNIKDTEDEEISVVVSHCPKPNSRGKKNSMDDFDDIFKE